MAVLTLHTIAPHSGDAVGKETRKLSTLPGVVVRTFNPSTLGAKDRQISVFRTV